MANQEQLTLLKQGVKVWNQWRSQQHSGTSIDLRGANLSAAKLDGADLEWADLSNANLSKCSLDRADLTRANLSETHLSEANLVGAVLSGASLCNANLHKTCLRAADLGGIGLRKPDPPQPPNASFRFRHAHICGADLRNADLNEADLRLANLDGASLDGANFCQAEVGGTFFVGVNLRLVKGLETVRHDGPSRIGIEAIYLSHGEIPETFLRGAGVPDSFISYVRSLVGIPIDFYSCFISYSSQDQEIAERLYADLQSNGVRCWFALEDLKVGDKIRPRIDESIRLYDKLLLVLSAHSVASQWVEQEVETALAEERKENRTVLLPIRLDNAVMEMEGGWPALIRNTRNIGDFTCWKEHDAYQKGLERLLRDLKAEA